MARKYEDNSVAPIIAMDFDGTVNIGGSFPTPGEVRPFAKEVINFLVDSGVKMVIYTSRDVAINQDTYEVSNDITPMVDFLNDNGIKFSAINKSVQFAPFYYNSRKIYAHLYVDDRGYGWVESPRAMIYVLRDILTDLLGLSTQIADDICGRISRGEDTTHDAEVIREYLKESWV